MTDLVERLHESWSSMGPVAAKKINRILLERKEAASRISQQDAELERLRRELAAERESVADLAAETTRLTDAMIASRLAASEALEQLAEARRAAFIEAAEMAEKQAPKAVRVFHEEANITPPVLKAAFEILASTLRAKAEETKP